MSWDEVLVLAQRLPLEATPSAARVRFMARLPKAPMAPVALQQAAGAEWHAMLSVDLLEIQQLLAPTLGQLPPPFSRPATGV